MFPDYHNVIWHCDNLETWYVTIGLFAHTKSTAVYHTARSSRYGAQWAIPVRKDRYRNMKKFFHNVIKNDSENLLRKTNVIWHWHQCHKCTQEIWLWHNVILPSFWLVQVFKNEIFILWRDSIEYEQTQLWIRRQKILYHKRGLKEHSQMPIRRQLWRTKLQSFC